MAENVKVDSRKAEAAAKRFIAFAKKKGLDVRMSQDGNRVEFFSNETGRKLSSSPINDFSF